MTATHTVTIKHDPESHEYDCHDDCTATPSCPGVVDSCRCWWECTTCYDAMRGLDEDARDDFDERLHEDETAHGEEHRRIDGIWMTPSGDCITHQLETDAAHLVNHLPDGEHAVDLDCDEGYVHVIPMVSEAKP